VILSGVVECSRSFLPWARGWIRFGFAAHTFYIELHITVDVMLSITYHITIKQWWRGRFCSKKKFLCLCSVHSTPSSYHSLCILLYSLVSSSVPRRNEIYASGNEPIFMQANVTGESQAITPNTTSQSVFDAIMLPYKIERLQMLSLRPRPLRRNRKVGQIEGVARITRWTISEDAIQWSSVIAFRYSGRVDQRTGQGPSESFKYIVEK